MIDLLHRQNTDPQTNVVIDDTPPGKEIPILRLKADKNKKTSTSVNKKTGNSKQKSSDQTIDELVKDTEPERSLIENLTKSENEPTITEKKDR